MRPNRQILEDLAERIHQNAMKHGWWDSPRTWGECMALVHTELAEATEELRNREPMFLGERDGKLDGVVIELADAVIRILDACKHFDVDVTGELETIAPMTLLARQQPIHRMATLHSRVPSPNGHGFRGAEAAMLIASCEGAAESFGHDLWLAVQAKHAFNLTRPYKHGRAR